MRAENFPAASKILKQIDATLSGLVSQVSACCQTLALCSSTLLCAMVSIDAVLLVLQPSKRFVVCACWSVLKLLGIARCQFKKIFAQFSYRTCSY
jgi:hypothetical protein